MDDDDLIELLGQLTVDDELAGDDDYDIEEILLGGHDDIIDVGGDDDELGRLRFRKRGVRTRSRRGGRGRAKIMSKILASRIKKQNYMNKINPIVAGAPQLGARNFPLGFGSFTFVNAGITATNLVANPQKPFKGLRLMVQVNRSTPGGELVTITGLDVGTGNQLVSSQALPAEGFAANAFDTMLSLDPSTPGIIITLGIAISATPAVGETISVSAMLIGNTIG